MALTRITKGVIKPNENYDTHNINSTGIITAVSANFSGNVTIGGTLTYEDVTSVDVVGVMTATGADINGDLDVDGHTNLDNVSIAGVTTTTGVLFANNGVRVPNQVYSYFGSGNDLSIRHDETGGHHSYIFHHHNTGVFKLASDTQMILGETGPRKYIMMNKDSDVKLYFNNNQKLATSNTGITITGTAVATGADINGDLDVDGHTELDNGNVSGVVTFTNSPNAIQMNDSARVSFGTSLKTSISYDASSSRTKIRNFNDTLEIGYRTTELHYINQARLTIAGSNTFSADANTNFLGDNYHAGWQPSNNRFQINDNAKLAFGSQGDTQIHHNNSNLLISNTTGNIDVTGNVVLNDDLDVDGHTNLDNVSIAGVTTTSGNITIENAEPSIFFTDTNGNPDYKIFNDSGALKIYDTTYNAIRLQIGPTNGEVTIASNTSFPNGITMNPGTASVVNTIAQRLGDTDTKIRFPANDTFTVETAGSERLRITSIGRVGIGTDNPQAKLEIAGSTTNVLGYSDGQVQIVGNNPIAFVSQSNLNPALNRWGFKLASQNDGDFSIYDYRYSQNRLLINSSGEVGIGIDNPTAKLHVSGSSTPTILNKPTDATPALFVGDSNRTGAGQHLAEYRGNWNGTNVARIVFHAGDDTTNKDNGEITLRTAAAGSTIERLRIDSSG